MDKLNFGRNNTKFWVPFVFFLLFSFPSLALQGKVVKVADGDTITVLIDRHKQIRIRLYGIDAPEKRQTFGRAAKKHLISFVANRNVEIKIVTQDRYGRAVALVFADGTNINQKMVEDGYAWVYRRYCKKSFCSRWLELEQKARKQKLGLWNDLHPVPPWEWRHTRKHKTRQGHLFSEQYRCGEKRYCKQMISCEEAYFFLKQCGILSLDRDGDGVPCEKLCK